MPAVSRYMTRNPATIERTASLSEAHKLMRERQVRHLPVVDRAGNLCGVVSQRDLHLIETLADVDPQRIRVEEAMVERPFAVTGDTSLEEVVEIMADHKYGSVVVIGHEGIEGIFTAVDACRAFAQVLHEVTTP